MMLRSWGDVDSCVEYDFLGSQTHNRVHDESVVALEVSRDNHGMTNNGDAMFRPVQSPTASSQSTISLCSNPTSIPLVILQITSISNTHDATQNFKKHSDLFFDNGETVISAQGPGSETISLFELHRKVLAARAKALSGVLMLPAVAPGRVDANEYFEGTPVIQPFDGPADLCVLCTGLEHGCGEIRESDNILAEFCDGNTALRMGMCDACGKLTGGLELNVKKLGQVSQRVEVYLKKRAYLDTCTTDAEFVLMQILLRGKITAHVTHAKGATGRTHSSSGNEQRRRSLDDTGQIGPEAQINAAALEGANLTW
jgi:hypothetical protein